MSYRISLREDKASFNIYLEDLWVGRGRTESAAYDKLAGKLEDCIAACEDALEQLSASDGMGVPYHASELSNLFDGSPLTLWRVDGGLELVLRANSRTRYSLGRVRGNLTATNTRQLTERVLRALQATRSECLSRYIDA